MCLGPLLVRRQSRSTCRVRRSCRIERRSDLDKPLLRAIEDSAPTDDSGLRRADDDRGGSNESNQAWETAIDASAAWGLHSRGTFTQGGTPPPEWFASIQPRWTSGHNIFLSYGGVRAWTGQLGVILSSSLKVFSSSCKVAKRPLCKHQVNVGTNCSSPLKRLVTLVTGQGVSPILRNRLAGAKAAFLVPLGRYRHFSFQSTTFLSFGCGSIGTGETKGLLSNCPIGCEPGAGEAATLLAVTRR